MSRYYSGPPSDHFDGKRFFAPHQSGGRGLGDLLKWRLSGNAAKCPKAVENAISPPPPQRVDNGDIRFTMIGHISVLVQVAGLNILTDPVWSQRASPVRFAGPKRVRAPGIALKDLPKIDLVLVSHNHYDHLDIDTLGALAAMHDPLVITPLGNDTIIRKGAPAVRTRAVDWDEVAEFGTIRIDCEPVNHWSARKMGDRNEALWSGFTLLTPAGKIFFSGDTAFSNGWWVERLLGKHGRIDAAMLPIGAYAPRWFMKDSHMDPDDAVEVHKMLGCPPSLGYHWGTFQMTDEPMMEPKERLDAALAREAIDPALFRTLDPGEGWQFTI